MIDGETAELIGGELVIVFKGCLSLDIEIGLSGVEDPKV